MSLCLVDDAIEEKLSDAAENPPYSLLRNCVDVPFEIALLKRLKIDDGKEKEVVIREEEKVADQVL